MIWKVEESKAASIKVRKKTSKYHDKIAPAKYVKLIELKPATFHTWPALVNRNHMRFPSTGMHSFPDKST